MEKYILKFEGEYFIKSSDLHNILNVKTRHNDWVKRNFDNLKEIQEKYKLKNNGFSYKKVKYIPIERASTTITSSKNVLNNCKALELLEIIKNITNKEIYIEKNNRKELEFGDMLEKFLSKFDLKFDSQVQVCYKKYKIDFLIGLIAIEYDETYHENRIQKFKDEKRMAEINDWFLKNNVKEEVRAFDWVRIKEGHEIEGLAEIVKLLSDLGYIEDGKGYQPYNLEYYINPNII